MPETTQASMRAGHEVDTKVANWRAVPVSRALAGCVNAPLYLNLNLKDHHSSKTRKDGSLNYTRRSNARSTCAGNALRLAQLLKLVTYR